MTGKVALVTGATDGVGRATAVGLGRMGATVLLVGRDATRGRAALDAIRAAGGNGTSQVLLADLSSLAVVRSLATRVLATTDRLDVLVNCAGVAVPVRTLSADGIELTLAVNHLAYFVLTLLLLDRLRASAPARIVNVTSEAEAIGVIDFENLMGERRYTPLRAYAQSKLANVLFTYELARRLAGSGITANCLHPGLIKTRITGGLRGPAAWLARLERLFARTPERGAETVLYLAASPAVEGISGKFFVGKRERRSSRRSRDAALAGRLWEVSERLSETAWSRGTAAS